MRLLLASASPRRRELAPLLGLPWRADRHVVADEERHLLGDPVLAALGVALAKARSAGLGATPLRKPRGQPRPPAEAASNTAFARHRVIVEHTTGRLRRYQCLRQPDRHHRPLHTERARAVAGLVNRAPRARFSCEIGR